MYAILINVKDYQCQEYCKNNGSENATAGIGICLNPDNRNNVSQIINDERYKNTNNLAEIMAVYYVLQLAKTAAIEKVKVHKDSKYAVLAIRNRMERCSNNGWKSYNKKIHHKQLFEAGIEEQLYRNLANTNVYGCDHLAGMNVAAESIPTAAKLTGGKPR